MKGTVCVNKPFGATSFDVVARLRRILKIKKIGHSGTLDPIATGVLPVFVGKATKAISFLPRTDKAYVAGFKLGQTTDTFDFTGKLICEKKSEISIYVGIVLLHGNVAQIKFSSFYILTI